jgi:cytochrome c553
MKKLVLTLAIIVAGAFTMQAQDGMQAASQKQALVMVSQITGTCHLTPDQASKITPFVQQFMQTKMENHSKFANNAEGMKEATKANRLQLKGNLKGILTEEQMSELAAYYKQQKGSNTYAPASVK